MCQWPGRQQRKDGYVYMTQKLRTKWNMKSHNKQKNLVHQILCEMRHNTRQQERFKQWKKVFAYQCSYHSMLFFLLTRLRASLLSFAIYLKDFYFHPVLLRHNWRIPLYKFEVCSKWSDLHVSNVYHNMNIHHLI